ncbi:rab-3A-interacting protein-like [Neodiprion fabricii]|uniref:rab-3A-interacting protein-like n=1 Tax=Neodiprion fabricii TaxID=2872261 RepID=UPI001ED8D224|nr:rab-3A-interacting protein-like [Neodiprion fabricii]XP_046431710.1 rab-3A-interacting protein-like [Neodiprion fabricii]XP_046431711.1 rab-3A-interacting protein-like [Neodiprion fabricii]XP_046431712.1 rab-3A-interacting protein-like [Neodiprion fabricii]
MDSSGPAVNAVGGCVAAAEYVYRPLTTKHRRAGSTGTTGDEEYTTDEEELYPEEAECSTGTNHPILKSDLARAATDLFGYEAKDSGNDDDDEPTGLFDEDEKQFHSTEAAKSSGKSTTSSTYNEENTWEAASPIKSGEEARVFQDPNHFKTINRFDDPSLRNTESSESVKNDSDLEFRMCKRPAGLILDLTYGAPSTQVKELVVEPSSDTSEADGFSQDSTTSRILHPASTRLAFPQPSLNPFCTSLHEGETKVDPRGEQEASLTTRSLLTSTAAEVEKFVKSEVESQSREELDSLRRLSNVGGSTGSSTTVHWGRTVAEVKEHAIAKLQDELRRAHQELKLKAEEVTRLSRIRQDVETELEDLTASLFQEAHNMVREANVRQATAERLLAESRMKSEVLAAEVAALKTLVLTSTPARPNPHLHPQIDGRSREETPGGIFAKRHRRSPSHFNLKYGRENSPPESPVKEQRPSLPVEPTEGRDPRDGLEVDPVVHKEFLQWKTNPCVDRADPFVKRIFREDIDLCLDFANKDLSGKVRQAVLDGIVFVEAVSDKTKVAFPKKCALLEAPRQCHYRMRLGDQENHWYSISQICRNRIIAVCDFLNYLRYIERGLVKSSVHDIYWEITRLRKEMVLARLGLALSS